MNSGRSVRVKTYLVAKDLWSLIKPTNEPSKLEDDEVGFSIWSKKNAEALYIIHICCGDDMFPFVSELDTAKAAWDSLEVMFKAPFSRTTVGASSDEDRLVPLMTVEDLKRELRRANLNVADSDAKVLLDKIQPLIPEYGGIRNALFIAFAADGRLDLIKNFVANYPEVLKARGSSSGATALYNAVFAEKVDVVKELVGLMSKEDLEVPVMEGATILGVAACVGNIQIAKYLVEKNEKLLSLKFPPENTLPLLWACDEGKWDMARYLYSVTPLEALTHEQNDREGAQLLSHSFYSQEFDIALDLIRKCPMLTLANDYSEHSPLYVLSTVRSAFLSGMRLTPWQKLIYNSIQIQPAASMVSANIEDGQDNQRNFIIQSVIGFFRRLGKNLLHLLGINHIRNKKLVHVRTLEMLDFMCKETKGLIVKQLHKGTVQEAIFQAIEQGNVELVRNMVEANPLILSIVDGKGKNMFQFSIECRQEKVYCFLFRSMPKNVIRNPVENGPDNFGNSVLHLAASLSSIAIAQLNHTQGAALQMQRELQWFKEVESIVPLKFRDMLNKQDHMRASELFTKNHKEMVKEGERQMKEISTSSTVVGALIVTMMFAAAFTFPGGTNGDTGMPMFLDKKLFRVFIVSDAISLFFSTTSIVIFLGILTSRFAENDFYKSLPKKLVAGLSTLFLSIATMMIAFVSALIIMLHQITWIIILAVFLASIPITSFAWMQSPLLVEMVMSTFGSGRFHEKY